MINIPCGKCGSMNIRKNGLTQAGARKYHCEACGFYGTPVTGFVSLKRTTTRQFIAV